MPAKRLGAVILGLALVLLLGFDPGFTQAPVDGGKGFKMESLKGNPHRLFDAIAKGRDLIVIAETAELREPLVRFAEEQGITNGQLTRLQFLLWLEQMKAKAKGIQLPAPDKNKDAWEQLVDLEFARKDLNGDGLLNFDEMEGKLRDNLGYWDTNKDNLIDRTEFRKFYLWKTEEKAAKDALKAGPIPRIVEDDELERRPVVYRAGKLPKELPDWLFNLDRDQDGQVSLAEWRKAGKPVDEFAAWDRNDDGLLTPAEALRYLALSKKSPTSTTAEMTMPSWTSEADAILQAGKSKGWDRPKAKDGKPKSPKKDKKSK